MIESPSISVYFHVGSYGFGGGAAVDYSAGRQRRIHSSAKDRTDSGVLLGSGSGYGNTGGDERGGLRSSGEQGWGGEGGGGGGVGGGWREGGSERGGDGWQGSSNDWVNKVRELMLVCPVLQSLSLVCHRRCREGEVAWTAI